MAEGGGLVNSMIEHVREEFTCAVCCELFNTPKTLSCLHTFCAKCLESSEEARRRIRGRDDHEDLVECPFCLSISKYAGGLNSIITNFVYNNIVEHLKVHNQLTFSSSAEDKPWCGKCQQNGDKAKPAVSYCYDCQALLCTFCEKMHKKTVDLAKHHICSIEEIKQHKLPVTTSWPKGDDIHTCTRHNDPFRLYCYTCHEVICRDCVVKKEDHRDHSYEFISEIIEKERANLLQAIEPLESMKEHISCCSNRIVAYQEELDSNYEQRSFRINRAVDVALELLEVRRGQLHEEARKDHEVKNKNLALELEHVEVVKSTMESVAEFTHTTIDKGSNTEVMIYKKGILARLETLKKKVASYQSFEVGGTDAVAFVSDLKPIKEFGMLCEVPNLQTSDTLGEGLDCPMQDEETSFILQARGAKGQPLLHGGGSCSVLITASPAPLGRLEVVSNTVTDNRDGTYTVAYRPTYPGINQVAVRFDGQGIRGSPFSVNVKRNFNRPIGEPRVYPLPNASPLGVAMITDSLIAVTASDSVVRVYDINGMEVNQFRSDLLRPYAISTDFENYLWITDREAHTVQKYCRNDDGTFLKLFHFGSRGFDAGQFLHPRGVAVNPANGLIYISDMKNNRIQIFKPEVNVPRYCHSFGSPGKDPGFFNLPAGICFNKDGNVVICDDHNCRLQEFDPEGRHIRTLGTTSNHKGLLCSPIGITTDTHGRYIITEFGSHCITFLNPKGEVLNCIKSLGEGYGQFVHPRGIAVDSSGYIYVADNENMRIARF